MTYRFVLKGYYDVSYFDISVKAKLDLDGHKYIRFKSRESVKSVLNFYKQDVCQGGKPSKGSCMSDTDFFVAGYKHWTDFERFIPRIVYAFRLRQGLLEIEPLHWGDSHDIDEALILDL